MTSGPFHSPERVQKQRHKTGISNSQNTLIVNKIDPKHVFWGVQCKNVITGPNISELSDTQQES